MPYRPKVVFVTPYWGVPRTGPEVYAQRLWEAFRDDVRFEFHVVATSERMSDHPRLHLLPRPASSLSLFRSVARQAMRLVGSLGPRGVIHVNNSYFHPMLFQSVWPVIGQMNDYEVAQFSPLDLTGLCRRGLARHLSLCRRRWLERAFVRRQARTLCISEYTMHEAIRAYGADRDRLSVAYQSVDVSQFIRPVAQPGGPCPAPGRIVSYVGSNFVLKGLDVLVIALTCMSRPATLVVAGVTRESFVKRYPGLVEKAESCGHVIRFMGLVPRASLPAMLWSSHAFAQPSRLEALGVALLEAVAAGLPCVASRTGGIPEIARHFDTISLVEPGDPHALARALDAALAGPTGIRPPRELEVLFGRTATLEPLASLYLELG